MSKTNLKIGLVQGFYWTASCIFVSFLVRFLKGYGYSDLECGTALSVSAIATLAVQPFVGYAADHRKSVKGLIVTCFLIACAGVGSIALVYKSRPITYAILFVIYGAYRSLIYIIDLWSMSVGAQDETFSYGVTRSFGAVFYAITALFFGSLLDRFSSSIVIPSFMVTAALAVISVIVVKEPQREAKERKPIALGKSLQLLFSNKYYVILLVSYMLAQITNISTQAFLTRKFETMGVGDTYTGLSLLLMGLLQLLPLLFMTKLKDRFSCYSLMAVCFVGFVARNIIIAFSRTPLGLVSCYLTEPFAFGLYIGVILYYMNTVLPDNIRYLGMTLYSAITEGLGGMIGNYSAGRLSDTVGVLNMMKLIAIPSLIGLLVYLTVFAVKKKETR